MGLNADVLRSSFALVAEREPELTARFYEILFERHPDAQELFHRNEPKQQQKMLQDALIAVIDHLEDAPWLTETLGGLGVQHVEYGVTEPMYGWVGECLLATLEEVAGEEWTPETAEAWTEAYGAIQDLMLAGAEQASPKSKGSGKKKKKRWFSRGKKG
jgi:hemoglobin-like flavoprotein